MVKRTRILINRSIKKIVDSIKNAEVGVVRALDLDSEEDDMEAFDALRTGIVKKLIGNM